MAFPGSSWLWGAQESSRRQPQVMGGQLCPCDWAPPGEQESTGAGTLRLEGSGAESHPCHTLAPTSLVCGMGCPGSPRRLGGGRCSVCPRRHRGSACPEAGLSETRDWCMWPSGNVLEQGEEGQVASREGLAPAAESGSPLPSPVGEGQVLPGRPREAGSGALLPRPSRKTALRFHVTCTQPLSHPWTTSDAGQRARHVDPGGGRAFLTAIFDLRLVGSAMRGQGPGGQLCHKLPRGRRRPAVPLGV